MRKVAMRFFGLVGCLLTWVLLAIGPSSAGEFDSAKLAAIAPRMQQFVDDGTVAGAVTVVGNSRGIAYLEAVGFQNLESKQARR
jgi:hypothetical protein